MSGTEKAMQGVADTLREFWAHRPVRPRAGRKLGGVATGIALRYRIDPVIVRIAFVALALSGGVGLPMYLAGWLLLPEEGDQVSPLEALVNKGHSSVSQGQTVLLGVLMFPALAFTFGSGGFQVFATIAASVACIYLLQKNRGHLQPAATIAEPPLTPPVPGAPAWDPLGAAPFAWDLPEPAPKPQPPAPRPRKPRVAGVTLGVATLVVAASAIAGAWVPWFTVAHVIGLAIAVLAAGLLVGSFAGGGRSLIWLLVPLSVVGFGLTAVDFDGRPGVGDLKVTPQNIGEIKERYELGVGSVMIDLRQLPDSGSVKTAVESDLGDMTVHVAKNADVTFHCEASSIGDLDCLGRTADGGNVQVEGVDLGGDGEGGLKIDLDVRANVGEVRVLRD
ncbi:PspC domain-containing protein [Lentzea sp. DG1S-22]|uniref:PspC domain-containing protein n=1 Tax=Lentzea sp. DG1S-22 TaxID=3108822 RepID=UPI002E78D074|nr:PspC domain-containing protein [Lentzea sp. DG1S-22]WVH79536.1 PspC domain-containing protein [Lentzea sp. DG1S-22]